MVYVDNEYYTEEYCGTAIPKDIFPQMAMKACRYIDYFTFDRLADEDNAQYPTLQACACEMAELIYRSGDLSNKEKKSESIDGYSVSYVTETTDGQLIDNVLKEKLYSIAKRYLMNTGLLCLEC